jgi:hypothetical protein
MPSKKQRNLPYPESGICCVRWFGQTIRLPRVLSQSRCGLALLATQRAGTAKMLPRACSHRVCTSGTIYALQQIRCYAFRRVLVVLGCFPSDVVFTSRVKLSFEIQLLFVSYSTWTVRLESCTIMTLSCYSNTTNTNQTNYTELCCSMVSSILRSC